MREKARLRAAALLLLAAVLFPLLAAQAGQKPFEKFTLKTGGKKYTYYVAAPEKVTAETPMIVFLHGSGERGDRALVNGLPALIINKTIPQPNAVVLVPQMARGTNWVRIEKDLISIVDHVAKEYGLKDENLVLAGFSMGSTNMWNIMTHYPDKFPKALMISGRTMWDIELKAFKHCDLKIVLGTKDTNIPPKANKAKAKKLIKRGYSCEVIELDATHGQLQKLVFTNKELMDWLCAPITPRTAKKK